jgi:MFS family permease
LTLALYIAAISLYWLSLYLYMPTLPNYVETKTHNLALVGTVLAQYGLWQMIVRLPLGIASSCVGRRKVFILCGLLLVGLGAYLMGSATGTTEVLVGRAIVGIGAATWVPLVVVFSSLFPPEKVVYASSLLTFIGAAGRVLSTGITGTLNAWGGYPLAFFLAAGAAGLAIVVLLPTREAPLPKQPLQLKPLGALLLRRSVLVPSLLSLIMHYAAWATSFGFIPILSRELGASDVAQSALMSMNMVTGLVSPLLTAGLVRRWGAVRFSLMTFIALSLGILLSGLSRSVPILFVSQLCVGLAFWGCYPMFMGLSIQYVSEGERSAAMGLHQAVYALGMTAGPWLGGIMAQGLGLRPMFGITAALCLILGLLGTQALRRSLSASS